MKKFLLLLIIPFLSFGQGWEQTFGGTGSDVGYSVQQTIDGGYIITGNQEFGGIYLLKTNESGGEEWLQTFSGHSGRSVQQTLDGGYIVSGSSWITPNESFFIIKTNANGNEEWSQTFSGNYNQRSFSVQQTFDGGYIIAGEINYDNVIPDAGLLIKTNENGIEEWRQVFSYGSLQSVKQTYDEGYVLTGYGGGDLLLLKTDENGIEEWNKSFGNPPASPEAGYSVQQTTDGGYIITGRNNDLGDNIWLIKTDEQGNMNWSQTFGESNTNEFYSTEWGNSVQQTTDGGYFITGFKNKYNFPYLFEEHVYIIKTDENGSEQWSKMFEGRGYSGQQTIDGGFIITGKKNINSSGSYILLIKTDEQGNIISTIEPPIPTRKRELLKTTNILGQKNTTIKNQPFIEIYDDGSVQKKYVIE